jgi:hypothetical protein
MKKNREKNVSETYFHSNRKSLKRQKKLMKYLRAKNRKWEPITNKKEIKKID